MFLRKHVNKSRFLVQASGCSTWRIIHADSSKLLGEQVPIHHHKLLLPPERSWKKPVCQHQWPEFYLPEQKSVTWSGWFTGGLLICLLKRKEKVWKTKCSWRGKKRHNSWNYKFLTHPDLISAQSEIWPTYKDYFQCHDFLTFFEWQISRAVGRNHRRDVSSDVDLQKMDCGDYGQHIRATLLFWLIGQLQVKRLSSA